MSHADIRFILLFIDSISAFGALMLTILVRPRYPGALLLCGCLLIIAGQFSSRFHDHPLARLFTLSGAFFALASGLLTLLLFTRKVMKQRRLA